MSENAHFWCKMGATNSAAEIVQGEAEQVMKRRKPSENENETKN